MSKGGSAPAGAQVGPGFELARVHPSSTPGFDGSKKDAVHVLTAGARELSDLQERLFAAGKFGDHRSVLLVLQAMDTAGKGGIVRHVIGSVDPQGIELHAFKAPTDEEKTHDFLWRIRPHLPGAGMIGVFDRSHYEDVLIGRVRHLASPEEIDRRYEQIVTFEREVVAHGTTIVKVMLHISPEAQKKRLEERLDRPDKHWKFNAGDIDERELWPQYMDAYERALTRTSTEDAPWTVVPADHKWYARLAVQHLLLEAVRALHPQWPAADFDVAEQKARLAAS